LGFFEFSIIGVVIVTLGVGLLVLLANVLPDRREEGVEESIPY